MFLSSIPKLRASLQLVSAPLTPQEWPAPDILYCKEGSVAQWSELGI